MYDTIISQHYLVQVYCTLDRGALPGPELQVEKRWARSSRFLNDKQEGCGSNVEDL